MTTSHVCLFFWFVDCFLCWCIFTFMPLGATCVNYISQVYLHDKSQVCSIWRHYKPRESPLSNICLDEGLKTESSAFWLNICSGPKWQNTLFFKMWCFWCPCTSALSSECGGLLRCVKMSLGLSATESITLQVVHFCFWSFHEICCQKNALSFQYFFLGWYHLFRPI